MTCKNRRRVGHSNMGVVSGRCVSAWAEVSWLCFTKMDIPQGAGVMPTTYINKQKNRKKNSDLGYIFDSKIHSNLKVSRQNFTRIVCPRRESFLKPDLDEKAYCFRRLIIPSERLGSFPWAHTSGEVSLDKGFRSFPNLPGVESLAFWALLCSLLHWSRLYWVN